MDRQPPCQILNHLFLGEAASGGLSLLWGVGRFFIGRGLNFRIVKRWGRMNNQTEYQVVIASDPLSRYKYFLNVVIDTAVVWVARSSGGFISTNNVDGRRVVPVFAREIFGDEWLRQNVGNTIESVPLDHLVEQQIRSDDLSGAFIAVMPTVADWGYIIEIPRFIRDVRMELDLIT